MATGPLSTTPFAALCDFTNLDLSPDDNASILQSAGFDSVTIDHYRKIRSGRDFKEYQGGAVPIVAREAPRLSVTGGTAESGTKGVTRVTWDLAPPKKGSSWSQVSWDNVDRRGRGEPQEDEASARLRSALAVVTEGTHQLSDVMERDGAFTVEQIGGTVTVLNTLVRATISFGRVADVHAAQANGGIVREMAEAMVEVRHGVQIFLTRFHHSRIAATDREAWRDTIENVGKVIALFSKMPQSLQSAAVVARLWSVAYISSATSWLEYGESWLPQVETSLPEYLERVNELAIFLVHDFDHSPEGIVRAVTLAGAILRSHDAFVKSLGCDFSSTQHQVKAYTAFVDVDYEARLWLTTALNALALFPYDDAAQCATLRKPLADVLRALYDFLENDIELWTHHLWLEGILWGRVYPSFNFVRSDTIGPENVSSEAWARFLILRRACDDLADAKGLERSSQVVGAVWADDEGIITFLEHVIQAWKALYDFIQVLSAMDVNALESALSLVLLDLQVSSQQAIAVAMDFDGEDPHLAWRFEDALIHWREVLAFVRDGELRLSRTDFVKLCARIQEGLDLVDSVDEVQPEGDDENEGDFN